MRGEVIKTPPPSKVRPVKNRVKYIEEKSVFDNYWKNEIRARLVMFECTDEVDNKFNPVHLYENRDKCFDWMKLKKVYISEEVENKGILYQVSR